VHVGVASVLIHFCYTEICVIVDSLGIGSAHDYKRPFVEQAPADAALP
jgi:hypothetical protein